MKKIAVIVLHYSNKTDTHECIQSLEKSTIKKDIQIIVVDNNPKDNFQLSSSESSVALIKTQENLGYAGGNNIGIRYAIDRGFEYIMLLNNDTTIDSQTIEIMLKTIEKDSAIGMVCPKIYFAKGSEYHKDRYKEKELGKVIWYAGGIMDWNNIIGSHQGVDEVDDGQYDEKQFTDFITGACVLIRAEILRKIGFFDERYFLYYEDSDLSMRVKQKNIKIAFAPHAFVWHKNAGSAGGSGSVLQDYYISRNRLLFGMTYASVRTKIALIKESLKILINGRKWQKKGIMDFFLQKFGKGSYS